MGLFTEQTRHGTVPNEAGCMVLIGFMLIGAALCMIGGLAAIIAVMFYSGRGMGAW